MPILPTIQDPADLRGLDELELAQLAVEIRETIVQTVARTGGHLGSSLGVVEVTIALHRLLESPRDRIVWDTGHQAYPHKLLTGRLERFGTLRQLDGIGGFPRRSESEHDVFDGGHAGTGLSIAEGLAEARDLRHGLERIAVVVGDAALMSGLSLEALNDIGQRQTQMLIVVNDNEMSISPTVGAFSKYLSEIKLSNAWQQSKSAYDRTVERIPVVGGSVLELSKRLRASVVRFAQPGQLFEDLGITYIGVVPGHDLHALLETLGRALALPGPDDRPRPDAEGPRVPAGRARPGRVPRGGPAADGDDASRRRLRRHEDPGADADRVDGRRCRAARRRRRGAQEEPELHRGLRRRADRARPDGSSDRRHHGRHADGHRHVQVPGRVPGPDVRRRDRRAAFGRPRDRAWRWAACGPSWLCIRPSSSGRSTRPSTTSARTTSRS